MNGRKIEISWKGLKMVIPISVLGFIFILNLYAEVLASPYFKGVVEVIIFLSFCCFLIIIGGVIEYLSIPLRAYVEKKLVK